MSLLGSKQSCEGAVQGSSRKELVREREGRWTFSFANGLTIKSSGLRRKKAGSMPLHSMDSEMRAFKESGLIGTIVEVNGRNGGRDRFPLSRSGGVQPHTGNFHSLKIDELHRRLNASRLSNRTDGLVRSFQNHHGTQHLRQTEDSRFYVASPQTSQLRFRFSVFGRIRK
jgi:hypothetical protein